MKIIAFDPGGTTGWAVYRYGISEGALIPESLEAGQLGPKEHHEELYNSLIKLAPDVVVCESFTHRQGNKVEYTPVEYIGVIKLYCEEHEKKLVLQSPSLKQFWNDDKLKQLNLFVKGKQHANDALRHLLYYDMEVLKNEYFIRLLQI